MKLELEIAVSQTGSGFQATVNGVQSVGAEVGKMERLMSAIGGKHNPFDTFTHGSDELFTSMLKTVSVVGLAEKALEGLHEGLEFVKESIGHADFVRDLNLSLTAYVGNVKTATAVIEQFDNAQVHTRNTAEELQQTFRNLNPLANTKGFSVDAQAQITVMLSQVATVANKSFGEIEAGYRRVLAGVTGGASRNALLQVLGISGGQLKNMGWDEFLGKLSEVSGKVGEFGQTWESTMHKAKEQLMNSFAEGFNEAHGSAVDGMDAITALVRDPAVKNWLHDVGVETAEWISKLAGVATEIRGIISLGKTASAQRETDYAIATLGLSKLYKYIIGSAGAAGLEQAAGDRDRANAAIGQKALLDSGIIRQKTTDEIMHSPINAPEVTGKIDIGMFLGGVNTLERMTGELIAQDRMSTAQIEEFTKQLKEKAGDAWAGKRAFGPAELNAAADAAMKMHLEGTPTGKVGGPTGESGSDQAKIRTKQLLAQAEVLDLQNQKLKIQTELDKEAQQLGEKKTGLDNVQLDAITKQILAQHEINALAIVALDERIEKTKALSDYESTIGEIDKKETAESAKPGGPTVSHAVFEAERAAAATKYGKTLDEINGKTVKGISDAEIAQRKLTLEAKATVQARTEELTKIIALVGEQREEDAVLAKKLLRSQQQGQLASIEVALQFQKVTFGSIGLDQQTDALLKQHESIVLQQTANDTEIAMQEERKRFAKEQADTAKQMQQQTVAGFTGEGVNPAIDQLTLLAAQQRAGTELHIQQIQADGHAKTVEQIRAESDLRNQAIDKATQGYIGMANVIASTTHDIFSGLLNGSDLKQMLSGLVSGYKSLLNDALDATVKKYITSWQQMAQGHIDPATGQMGHVDARTGQMVPTTPGQQQQAQMSMAAVQGALALYSIYSQSQGMSKGQAALAGGMSGLATGAAIGSVIPGVGTVIGAVVGMIVGAVIGAIAGTNKAGYNVTVSNGQIHVTGSGSAHQADVDAAIAQINQQIQVGTTAVHGLFDAFPLAIGQSLNLKDLGSVFQQQGTRWFDSTTLKTFESQDIPAAMLKAYTPLIQGGLASLGVAQAKIASLFSGQATLDPSAFFKFITDYVAGFVAMKNSIDFLGKSSIDKTGVAVGLANPQVGEQLAKANENIAYLGQGFDKLTNTDQVARLGQINAAIAQRYAIEIQALADIANARKAINTSYADTRRGFAMSEASPEQQLRILEDQRAGVAASLNDQYNNRRQLIAGAKTPAEVTAIADSYAQLTVQIYNSAKSLRDSFQTVLDSFQMLSDRKAADLIAAMDPSAQLAAIANKSSAISANFAGMSDADKIKNSQTLLQLANQYYDVQKQALIDLKNAAVSIHDSVTKQIFGIQYDQLKNDPQAQLEMLMAQQRTLYASIGSATTAAQVDAIMQQIQGNVTTIAGLEGNTPQAAADSIKALQEADKAAQLQLAALTAQAKANDDAIAASIKGVTDNVTSTIAALNTLMTQATADLIAFQQLIQRKLDTFVDAMAKSDAALLLTLQPIFTALGNSATVIGNSFDGANTGLITFTGKLDAASDALERFSNGAAFQNSSFSSASSSTSTAALSAVFSPRFSVDITGNMAPFVSMVRIVVNQELNSRQQQEARFLPQSGGL